MPPAVIRPAAIGSVISQGSIRNDTTILITDEYNPSRFLGGSAVVPTLTDRERGKYRTQNDQRAPAQAKQASQVNKQMA